MQRNGWFLRYLSRNRNRIVKYLLLIIGIPLLFVGCKKEDVVFEDNDAPPYAGVSTIVLSNYVNRLFIDLIGREPLDSEMTAEIAALRADSLSLESRGVLVDKLMNGDAFIEGDSTYRRAYSVKLYENLKARFIEGASDALLLEEYDLWRGNAISDSLNGNMTGYALKMQEANRLQDVLNSRAEWQGDEIEIDEMVRRMMFNSVYDNINMNAFNFVNASFDDLFFRFPTQPEFESAYTIIEFNQPAVIFNTVAQNKSEYLNALTATGEFHEGMVVWVYRSLLSREPNTVEVYTNSTDFSTTQNISAIQRAVLISDEYAGFE
jgi:hypothetical protein